MARRSEAIAVLGRAVRTPRGATGLVIAGLVVLVAVIGPAVAPYSTTQFVTSPFARASSTAWLGGDAKIGKIEPKGRNLPVALPAGERFRRYREGNSRQLALFCPCGALPPLTAGLCNSCYWNWRYSLRFFGGVRDEILDRDGRPLPGLRLGLLGRDPPPRGRVESPIITYISLRRLPRPGPPVALPLEVDPGTPRRALGRTAPRRPRPAPDLALGPAASCRSRERKPAVREDATERAEAAQSESPESARPAAGKHRLRTPDRETAKRRRRTPDRATKRRSGPGHHARSGQGPGPQQRQPEPFPPRLRTGHRGFYGLVRGTSREATALESLRFLKPVLCLVAPRTPSSKGGAA